MASKEWPSSKAPQGLVASPEKALNHMSPPTATTAPCLSSQCSEDKPRGGRSLSKSSIMGQKGRSWHIKCAPALRQSQKHFLCVTNKCLWHLHAVQAPLTTFTAGQTLPEEPPSLATAEASLSRVLGRQNDGNDIFPSRRKAALPPIALVLRSLSAKS